MNKIDKKVLIIGLDGATWKILMPWAKKGYLPSITKLMKNGCYGVLESTIPPSTAVAWNSFMTGKNPGKHGVFDFLDKDYNLMDIKNIKDKRFWDILAENNKKCFIMNVPLSYSRADGVDIIGGFCSPQLSNDNKKIKRLMAEHEYQVEFNITAGHADEKRSREMYEQREKYLEGIYELIRKRYLVAEPFLEDSYDLITIVFRTTDLVQHLFWDQPDIILKFYKKLDVYIGRIVQKFKADYVIVVSDHGFQDAPKKYVNMRVLLEEQTKNKFRDVLSKIYPKIPKFITNLAREKRERLYSKLVLSEPVFYKSPGLYIDRDKFDNYEKFREQIIRNLREFKDDEKYVFSIVAPPEEIYKGKCIKNAPDIVIIPEEGYGITFSYSDSLWQDFYALPGTHLTDRKGILIISGEGIQRGVVDASIMDIAPTVLDLMGIENKEDMDGEVINAIWA